MKLEGSFAFGEPVASGRLTPEHAASLVRLGRERAAPLRAKPVAEILASVGQLRPLWGRGGPYREAYLRGRAEARGASMVELALDRLAAGLVPGLLERRLDAQLGDAAALDRFTNHGGRVSRAEPLGAVLHVVTGEVFVEPVELLISSLVTKNASIVKCPAGQEPFLRLFQKSLAEVAPDLAGTTAVLSWANAGSEIEAALAGAADAVVVAAPPQAVVSWRRLAGPGATVVELAPRVSFAVVSHEGRAGLSHAALAHDVALWDQQSSTAAQLVYVQGAAHAKAVASGLATALEELEGELPSSPGTLNERVEVGRLRDTARFGEAVGAARLYASGANALWTVVHEEDRRFVSSPLRRSVRVKAFDALADLSAVLAPARAALGTAGVAVCPGERAEYLDALSAAGVRRICGIGRMNLPAADELKDGVMELHRLVRWVQATL